ncbi:hypothetical protein PLESTB_000358300 [Pleodorina starrii]|uniref:SET domain-containing protein n=1 Tax=Pleodorina starrii TaxID=330485 RepID=A0A9W6BDN9_9CHLO|nr:hypothetical protein PLESTM_000037100 [Pleodorina starrii]GLC50244.1 hypothetical protein PLESTB_000358300 [Pleodorina starrii]GLC64374.1 hypothetical protein PLESTF_000154400 [Pleodorina starrii]
MSRPTQACSFEQVVHVLLLHLPLNRDLVRLCTTCSVAVKLRRHLEALRLDFSLGAEPQYPIAVLAPPPSSLQPPVPPDFAYTTAFEPLAFGGGGLLADTGCDPSCVCCGGSGGNERGLNGSGEGGGSGADPNDSDQSQGPGWGLRCACGVAVPGGQRAYDPRVRGLLPALRTGSSTGCASVAYILECGPACACVAHTRGVRQVSGPRPRQSEGEAEAGASAGVCPARLTQRGVAVRLALRWTEDKGWGVVALEPIPAGRFVCLYGGEYLTTPQAEARLRAYDTGRQGHALLVVREVLPSGLALRINIDATSVGNVARFFNHSCDGGSMALVVVHRRGSFVPAVALFASRDVAVWEELTFAYGPPSKGRRGVRARAEAECDACVQAGSGDRAGESRPCRCGTSACLGYLPNEAV